MGYSGWLEFNGQEIVNVARTAELARALGVSSVRLAPASVSWVKASLGGTGYDDITDAPWYDASYPASGEFIGVIPLSFTGLDDSGRDASVTEYLTDGGSLGRSRNTTSDFVAELMLVGSTDRGVQFGRRWLVNALGNTGKAILCAGAELRYFPFEGASAQDIVHRRDVAVSKGMTTTRKRNTACSVAWTVTVTLAAGDPYEYGPARPRCSGLGGSVTGPTILSSGSIALVQQGCPRFDYSPMYDPGYPAMVPPPSVPDFAPDGWGIENGMTFDRFWVRVPPLAPCGLPVVPKITLSSTVEARRVRVSIWPSSASASAQCDPLFSATVTYLPANVDLTIDGEAQAVYVWDGASSSVQRADSLVYALGARPMRWSSFTDPSNLLITLDIFGDSGELEGAGQVRAAVSFVQKSE